MKDVKYTELFNNTFRQKIKLVSSALLQSVAIFKFCLYVNRSIIITHSINFILRADLIYFD